MGHDSGMVTGRTVRVYFRGKLIDGKLAGVCEGQDVMPEDGKWPELPKKGDVWSVKLSGYRDGHWIGTPVEKLIAGTSHIQRPRPLPAKPKAREPQPKRRREIVTFRAGDNDTVITSIDRKISFPGDRGDWGMDWPKPGEEWEVEILAETRNKRAFILKAVRKISG